MLSFCVTAEQRVTQGAISVENGSAKLAKPRDAGGSLQDIVRLIQSDLPESILVAKDRKSRRAMPAGRYDTEKRAYMQCIF